MRHEIYDMARYASPNSYDLPQIFLYYMFEDSFPFSLLETEIIDLLRYIRCINTQSVCAHTKGIAY